MKIDYEGRVFRSLVNSETGEVSGETRFFYHQRGDLVWAEYSGGEIVFGQLIAKVSTDDSLEMRYQHLNRRGELMTGECLSVPAVAESGKLRLHERWQWTSGDRSRGESIVEEIER